MKELLTGFGPLRKSYHPEEPFVRLKNEGIWKLNQDVNYQDPSNKKLLKVDVADRFTMETFELLKQTQIF